MSDDPGPLLDQDGVARHLGLSPSTVRAWRSRGALPMPDVWLGRSPGWYTATIDAWAASRPGRGYRTDLHRRDAK